MRDQILSQALQSLHTEGLRFSVDVLAARMKISKKTIYKYFPTKEALALAMYEQYYAAVSETMARLLAAPECDRVRLLRAYYDAKQISREEIFNKYNLNNVIRAYTAAQNNKLWAMVAGSVSVPQKATAVRIIVDGAFEKLCRADDPAVHAEDVIERLVKLI